MVVLALLNLAGGKLEEGEVAGHADHGWRFACRKHELGGACLPW
jgi:hypothetical protein